LRNGNKRYLRANEIGHGAYGKVYMGLDSKKGRIVAIKQITVSFD